MCQFLTAHRAAYGMEHIKPKHHYAMHNALQAERGDLVLDCFVHERKHQVLKRAATPIKNTVNFERSVLARALLEQCRQLQALAGPRCLVGDSVLDMGVAVAWGAAEATLARGVRFEGLQVKVGDLVFYGHSGAGFVRGCAQSQGSFALLLEPMSRAAIGVGNSRWVQKAESLLLVELGEVPVSLPYCWAPVAEGGWRVLHSAARLSV